jgi:hypothetical protein
MQHMVFLEQIGVGVEGCVRWWCVAMQDGRIIPKRVELK